MRRILVTGAGGNAARNFIESLRMGYNEIYIVGVDINKYHLACVDVDTRYLIPNVNDPTYLQVLNTIIEIEGINLIHAQPDIEVEFIATHKNEIKAKTFLPSTEVILRCRNKMETYLRLNESKIPVPKSFLVQKLGDISNIIRKLPTEIKWVRAVKGAGSKAALPVKTVRQAKEWINYWRDMRNLESQDFMICEFLPGREFAWQSIWNKGRLVTSMARERLEYLFGNLTPSGQSSSPSVAKSIHYDKLNMTGIKAVQAVDSNPQGIYCIDMKENYEGVPCVTEINAGRFFTTSNFFSTVGANMPQTYIKLAFDENIGPIKLTNASPSRMYWIRGVDRRPTLLTEDELQERIE